MRSFPLGNSNHKLCRLIQAILHPFSSFLPLSFGFGEINSIAGLFAFTGQAGTSPSQAALAALPCATEFETRARSKVTISTILRNGKKHKFHHGL